MRFEIITIFPGFLENGIVTRAVSDQAGASRPVF
jgi:hypothetical protein